MAYGEELNNIRGFWWKSGALGGNVKISKVLPFEERNGTFSLQREKFYLTVLSEDIFLNLLDNIYP